MTQIKRKCDSVRLRRILYLVDGFQPPGGVQNLSILTLRVLRRLSQDGRLKYISFGFAPAELCCKRAFGSGLVMQLRVAWSWFARRITFIFSDHLHTARFASRLGATHIFWAHLIEFDAPLDEMHRRSIDTSLCIVCNSEHTRRRIAHQYPTVEDKLRVVQLGDQPRDLLSHPLYPDNIKACQLVMIGRMDEREKYKGHDQVLEALPFVLKSFSNCKLNIVGSGSDSTRLHEKAKSLGLANHVAFLGSLDDEALIEVVKNSTNILLPSLREGFGLVFLYALWAGIPAVAIKGTVAEEVLGDCGVYADTQTPEAIARAIESTLSGDWSCAHQSQLRYKTLFCFEAFQNRLGNFLLSELRNLPLCR
jgi:glycosyltransferase involved in cell wall biosynthesis